jgi:hypothetical protein
MSLDRHLVDAIKEHFARKTSAQLQVIVQVADPERWSPEGIVAAGEALRDRLAGRTPEPLEAEEERLPPPAPPDPYSLAFLMALGTLGGFGLSSLAIGPLYRFDHPGDAAPAPDVPVPFGPKMAWLAIDSTDTVAVATALDLREAQPATWDEGVRGAYQSSIFVTPPLGDWTLALGTALFPKDRVEAFVQPLLERLSRQFGNVQYFCTHRVVELHVWARVRQGRLIRGYGWLGEKGLTLWDEGAPTSEERNLGFQFLDGRSATGASPDETGVMQIANLWSIDPTSLDEEFMGGEMGLLGDVAWAESTPGQST